MSHTSHRSGKSHQSSRSAPLGFQEMIHGTQESRIKEWQKSPLLSAFADLVFPRLSSDPRAMSGHRKNRPRPDSHDWSRGEPTESSAVQTSRSPTQYSSARRSQMPSDTNAPSGFSQTRRNTQMPFMTATNTGPLMPGFPRSNTANPGTRTAGLTLRDEPSSRASRDAPNMPGGA